MTEAERASIALIVREVVGETLRSLSSIVDIEARHGVSAALQKIESHERVCGERDKNADEQRHRLEDKIDSISERMDGKAPVQDFAALTKKIDGLYRIIWSATLSIMGVMLVLIGFLAKRELFP